MERISRGFVIRHKESLNVMPQPFRGRGGSHLDPKPPSKCMPRIFPDVVSAKGFLSQWERGKIFSDEDGSTYAKPQPHRNKKEFEIIEVFVVIED